MTVCKTCWCNHNKHALFLQRKMAWVMAVYRERIQEKRSLWLLGLPPFLQRQSELCLWLTGMSTHASPLWKSNWRKLFLQWSVVKTEYVTDTKKIADKLREHVISISADNFHIFHGAEVKEVRGTVYFVVELFGIGQLEFVTHVRGVANTCKTRKSGC